MENIGQVREPWFVLLYVTWESGTPKVDLAGMICFLRGILYELASTRGCSHE